jgi:hypothetical protein
MACFLHSLIGPDGSGLHPPMRCTSVLAIVYSSPGMTLGNAVEERG